MQNTLPRRQPLLWINSQTPPHKILCFIRHILPILGGLKTIIARHDGLHFLDARVTVKGRVTTEEKVGYDAEGPDVDGFAVAGFLEDFGGHVAGGAACCGEDVEGFFVYDAGEAEIGD